MMRYLCISVRLLAGHYHGLEWPPSPRRLFLGMVAADPRNKDLRLLEGLKPPTIYAPEVTSGYYMSYAPSNQADVEYSADMDMDAIVAKTRTTKKPHKTCLVDPDISILYVWEVGNACPDPASLKIHSLGWGIDVATIRAEILDHMPLPGPSVQMYVPSYNGDAERAVWLHVPKPGLMDESEERHRISMHAFRRLDDGRLMYTPTPEIRNTIPVVYGPAKMNRSPLTAFKIIMDDHTVVPERLVGDLVSAVRAKHPGSVVLALPTIGEWADFGVRRIAVIGGSSDPDGNIFDVCGIKTSLKRVRDGVIGLYAGRAHTWCTMYPVPYDVVDSLPEQMRGAVVNLSRIPYLGYGKQVPDGMTYAELDFGDMMRGPLYLGGSILAPIAPHRVVVYDIKGRQPKVESTAVVGAMLKRAVLSQVGRYLGNIPSNLSGHQDGNVVYDNHAHAYWLPMDMDDDGYLDRIVVYMPDGIDRGLVESGIFERIRNLHDVQVRFNKIARRLYHDGIKGEFVTNTYCMPKYAKSNYGPVEQIKRELEEGWDVLSCEEMQGRLLNHRNTPLRRQRYRVVIKSSKMMYIPILCGHEQHFGLGHFIPVRG